MAGLQPVSGLNTHVTRHGGPVMDTPRVFAIFMGRDWGDPSNGLNAAARALTPTLESIFSDTGYWAPIAEYGCKAPIFLGSAFHDYSQPGRFYAGNPARFGTGVILPSGGSIEDLLTHILDTNPKVIVRPAASETNLLYLLMLSSNHSVWKVDERNDARCGLDTPNTICGFHSSGHYRKAFLGIPIGSPNLLYAVGCPGITTGGITHELVEAFTDPAGSGWYSDDGSEIGDICNQCTAGVVSTRDGHAVASYWRQTQGRCLQQEDVTPPSPAPQ